MNTHERYRRAPIQEAVIDLLVTLPSGFSMEQLAKVGDAIKDQYPETNNLFQFTSTFDIELVAADANKKPFGIKYTSADQRRIWQARINGCSFSVLAPYDRWETFRDEAYRLWRIYRDVCRPDNITRAAVRYINRIDIPAPLDSLAIELKDYLNVSPEITKDFRYGTMSTHFMQIQIPQTDIGAVLVINEASVSASMPATVSVVLDLDLFREQEDSPWDTEDDTAVWNFLERLRVRKNEIFEASITDETRKLIR